MNINFNNLVTPQYVQTEKSEHKIEYIQYFRYPRGKRSVKKS